MAKARNYKKEYKKAKPRAKGAQPGRLAPPKGLHRKVTRKRTRA